MKIFLTKDQLIKRIQSQNKIGFVPTMGALHFAHKTLIKKSKAQCSKTVVSIFVNKPQFNRKKDFKKYPKYISSDISILKKLKVDYLFLPSAKEIYPEGINKSIKIHPFSNKLCGKFRPGHFIAVVDVVERLLKIVKPSKIYLGEKDFQQLIIIEDFVEKNYKNIKVIGCKTIREKNGLPLSSRNLLLNSKEKLIGSRIYKIIYKFKKKLIKKEIPINFVKNKILALGVKKIEYICILNINKIKNPYKKIKRFKVFISYFLGSTRIIDNI